jgi:hypothetical protein
VVCATEVYSYESGKDTKDGFKPRPKVGNSTYDLIQLAKFEARSNDWRQRLGLHIPNMTPNVHVAPIAAGDKVVESTSSHAGQLIKDFYGDAVAVEMEGYGFLNAMHGNRLVQALVIRGISDLVNKEDFNKNPERDQLWQPIAADHASAFTFELLAKLAGELPPVKTNDFEIFYSYVAEDKALMKRLQTHLVMLKRRNLITDSYGSEVAAGGDTAERMAHLNKARIILLLISPEYLASEDHYDVEVARAMERQKEGQARVIPILLRPTDDWKHTPFGHLQPIPRSKIAITEVGNLDSAFYNIAGEIREVVELIRKELGFPLA